VSPARTNRLARRPADLDRDLQTSGDVACRVARSLRDEIDEIRETKLSEKTYIV
jgi:hypothetical protein